MPLFSRHSLLLQTAYSEVKRAAGDEPQLLMGTPGSVSERTVNGGRFYYRQYYDAEGNKVADYIGKVGEADEKANQVRDQIARANALRSEARTISRAGYVRVDGRTGAILAAMANHQLFRGGAVLVGSHAFGAILNELGVKAAAYLTEDIDIARESAIKVGAKPEPFATILAASGVPLLPVPPLDPKGASTSFKARGASRLRVDLLVPGRGLEITQARVPELDAHATALPYLGFLLQRPAEGVVLGREGVIPVSIPRPEVFAWHKALLAELRGASHDKRRKDLHQAAVLFAALAEDAPDALEAAFAEVPRGARGKTKRGVKQVVALLEAAGHPRAAELLEGMLR